VIEAQSLTEVYGCGPGGVVSAQAGTVSRRGMMVAVQVWRPGRLAVDAAVSVAAALITTAGHSDRVAVWLPHSVIVPLAVGQGLLLLARRRAPMAVLAATTLLGVFMLAVGYPAVPATFATWCAAYALAVHGRRAGGAEATGTLWGTAPVLAAAVAVAVASVAPGARDHSGAWSSFTQGALIAACWALGYALRTRREYVAELKDRAARLEAAEGERAARAVVDERLRIARELHDVIGHSISLIVIQSEAAARSARSNPDAVPAFLSRISAASRQALVEMRGVLAVLRPDAEAELSPQPGLEQVGGLVASLRAGGLETRLEVEPMYLPPGMALAVYRIVQESLTNVLRHAGAGAKAGVTIIRSGGTVRVSVHDDGAGPSGRASSTAHGIVGMRERVAAYGGTLRTGARPGGGFEVEASIPLPGQETP
jgi:signal transduction histidine kinase